MNLIIGGDVLADQTDDGPTTIQVLGGLLMTEPVGTVAIEGEYNIVADVDADGFFDPSVDRIDRIGIGLFVLPP